MAAKSHVLDYENDDDAREIDKWLTSLRKYRPPQRQQADEDDEVQYLSSNPSKPNKRLRLPSSSSSENHICYLDESTKTLHDTHPQIRDEDGHWIWASNPNRRGYSFLNDVNGMERKFEVIKARHADDLKKISIDMVLDLAIHHEVLCGKWMLFRTSSGGNNPAITWTKIRNAVFNNELGCTAKIKKKAEANGLFVICVYCRDFRDKPDVLRVRRALRAAIDDEKALYFKPDALTYLGINAGNPYGMKTTIYTCGKDDPDCSTMFVNRKKCTHGQDCPRCFPRCMG